MECYVAAYIGEPATFQLEVKSRMIEKVKAETGRKREREREMEIFNLLGYSPNRSNIHYGAVSNQEPEAVLWFLTCVAGAQLFGPSSMAFQEH